MAVWDEMHEAVRLWLAAQGKPLKGDASAKPASNSNSTAVPLPGSAAAKAPVPASSSVRVSEVAPVCLSLLVCEGESVCEGERVGGKEGRLQFFPLH